MRKSCLVLLFFIETLLFFSCSLNYFQNENSEALIPEFTFRNARYARYENDKKSLWLEAAVLEQYKSDNAVFSKDVRFESFDSDGGMITSGECRLLSADSKKEIYTMFGDVRVDLHKQEMRIHAGSLSFNKRSEQLVSDRADEVRVQKKDLSVSGYGFSASGVSRTFAFFGEVSGLIQNEDGEPE